MPDPLVPGLPSIVSLSCVSTLIRGEFDYAPSRTVTLGLFQRSVTGKPLATATGSGAAASIFYQGTLDPAVVYYVALAFDPANGPWGLPVALVWQTPALSVAYNRLERINLAWTLPVQTTISQVRASLYNASTWTRVATGLFSGSGAELVLPVPLDPQATYKISLIGTHGVSAGAEALSPPLSFASPAISTVGYTAAGPQACTLTVSLQDPVPAQTSVCAQLFRDGAVVQQQTSGSGPVTLALSRPLDPRSNWQIRANYVAGVLSGPPGAPFAVDVPAAPPIASVFYAGGSIVVLLAKPPVPRAAVALFRGSPVGRNWISSTTIEGRSANLTVAAGVLDPSFEYTVAVTLDATAPVVTWGPATPLVWQQPTLALVSVASDGVDIGWTLPVATTISSVTAVLYDSTGEVVVASGTFNAQGGRLSPALPLDPSHNYIVSVAGTNGLASAEPVVSPRLILAAPQISAAVYTTLAAPDSYQVAVTAAVGDSPPGSVVGQLLADGAIVATQAAAGSTVTFARNQPLDASVTWQVALAYRSGLVVGPAGMPVTIPHRPPRLVSAVYDGSTFKVAWSEMGGVGATIVRVDDGIVVGQVTTTDGFSATIVPQVPIDGAKRYSLILVPVTGSARGIASAPIPLIVSAPLLTGIQTSSLQAKVDLAGVDPVATTTELLLSTTDGSLLVTPAGLKGGFTALPHSVSDGLTLAARARAGGILGPPSTPAPLVLLAPTIKDISFDGEVVSGSVTLPASPVLDTPIATITLLVDGSPAGESVRANAQGAFSLPATPAGGIGLSLIAALSGTASGAALIGPSSLAVPVLSSEPEIASASLTQVGNSAWKVAAQWCAPAGTAVERYRVTLAQTDTPATQWTVTGTSLLQDAPSFDVNKALALTVQAIGNHCVGPRSRPMRFLPSAIGTVSARVDGRQLSATWATRTLAGSPSGFRLRLVESAADGGWVTVASSPEAAATTAVLPLPSTRLDAGAVFGVAVDAAVGGAWVSTQAVTRLLTTAPSIASAAALAEGSTALEWAWPGGNAPAGVDGYIPVVIWNGNETPLAVVPATPLQATIALPPTIPADAWIALRAVSATIIGPVGDGAPLLTEAPGNVNVDYDGTTLLVSWSRSTQRDVGNYVVTFTLSGEDPVVQTAAETRWQKAIVIPPGKTATIAVAALAGAATGPAAPTVAAIQAEPAITRVAFDGSSISTAWTEVAGSNGYIVDVTSARTGVVRSINTNGASAVLPVVLDPAQAFTVRVRAVSTSTSSAAAGPRASARIITLAPAVQSIDFDSDEGCTITWMSVPDVTGYRLLLACSGADSISRDVPASQGPTVSITLPSSTFNASSAYSVAISAVATVDGCTLIGPSGKPVPIITHAPGGLSATFNGSIANVTWDPLPDASVTSYRVSQLSGNVSTMLGETNLTQLSAPLATWTAADSIVVQAITAQPASAQLRGPGARTPLTQRALFLSSGPSVSYIAPARISPVTPSVVTMLLPDLFSAAPASLPNAPPFEVALIGPAPGMGWQPGLWYQITFAADSAVWDFTGQGSGPIRTAVRDAYRTFLSQLHDASASPLAISTVQQAMARAMPQTYAETLYYSYGVDFAGGYFDLRPGMILRVEYAAYQGLGAMPDSQYLSGFVTSATAEYEIASYSADGKWLIGLDAFLANLAGAHGLNINPAPPQQGKSYGGAGAIDAFFSQFEQPFLRLVYAPDLLANSSTGSAIIQRNPVLIAANNLDDIEAATLSLRRGNPPGSEVAALYLRGRATFSAAIDVFVNGHRQRVAIGTTIGNVLSARAARPPAAGLSLVGIRLLRSGGATILAGDSTSTFTPGEGLQVRLDWISGIATAPASDWLDLPLLHGDRIELSGDAR